MERFELEPSWAQVLKDELKKPYIRELEKFTAEERKKITPIYPPKEFVFNAFYKTPFDAVNVVILGQDPYHRQNQAHGLSFSVLEGVKLPPSLKNILKELSDDLNLQYTGKGCLDDWAKQGVLLLNATLTVSEGDPLSHHGRGWETFTDAVIESLINRKDPICFVLWGKSAEKKAKQIEKNPIHYVLKAPHPSPFSAHTGFLGCRHFSKINQFLEKSRKKKIDWNHL